jgi:hypothetical protein
VVNGKAGQTPRRRGEDMARGDPRRPWPIPYNARMLPETLPLANQLLIALPSLASSFVRRAPQRPGTRQQRRAALSVALAPEMLLRALHTPPLFSDEVTIGINPELDSQSRCTLV